MRVDITRDLIEYQLFTLQAMLDMWMRRVCFGELATVRVNGIGWR